MCFIVSIRRLWWSLAGAWIPTEIEDPSPATGVGGTLGIHVAVSKLGKVSGFCVTFLEVYRSEVLRAAATLDHVTEVSVSEEEGVEWRERMGES